jgi:uncharacterized lipoprotein YajG
MKRRFGVGFREGECPVCNNNRKKLEEGTMKAMPGYCFVLVMVLAMMTGCATNRSIVSLERPETGAAVQPSGKTVYIKEVADKREFQDNPPSQEIPSLGFEGASAATDAVKKRAIGRKRNTFGKAIGDFLLEEGQTVESVVGAALRHAFKNMGYTPVSSPAEVKADTVVVSASVEKFWTYMTPGFWALTLSCDIATTVTVEKAGGIKKETVSVKQDGSYQIGTESNYMEVVNQALDSYEKKVADNFSNF